MIRDVQRSLEAAQAVQERTNAFITLLPERATGRARAVADGGPLAGVPVAVKDNLCLEGAPTTAGSRMLESFVPPYSATVVERLESAGAVVIGKTNLDEFGMGSTNENSAFGAVLNPHDAGRVAGGSSGGSAAAVAAGVVPLALGSDTGGSVRLPAAFCGVVGFKPTYGALSRYGLVSYASSLDQVGVLARDVATVEVGFAAMRGRDRRDQTSRDAPGQVAAKRRVAILTELAGDGMEDDVLAGLERARHALSRAGLEVVEVSVPEVRQAVAAYYLIATAEASSNLARYDGTTYGGRVGESSAGPEAVAAATRTALLGREVKRRVLMGAFALSAGYRDAYHATAVGARRAIAGALTGALVDLDALVTPTAVSTAYRLGERMVDPVAMYAGDVATCLANLAGLPAISLPAGEGSDGLPVGVQLMGAPWADDLLLATAREVEPLLA